MALKQASNAANAVLEEYRDPENRLRIQGALDALQESLNDAKEAKADTAAEDDLVDVPVEQRALVAREIALFRDRSSSRDVERLKRERDLQDRQKKDSPVRRLDAKGANSDTFANHHKHLSSQMSRSPTYRGTGDQRHSGPTDIEMEERRREDERQMRLKDENDRELSLRERQWLSREKTRGAAIEREVYRSTHENERQNHDREIIGRRLAEWSDELEAKVMREEYYRDRSAWIRHRAQFRDKERQMDAADREDERREHQQQNPAVNPPLDTAKQENGTPAKFKLSMGNVKRQDPPPSKSSTHTGDVLGTGGEETEHPRKPLARLEPPQTKEEKMRQLAGEIPVEHQGILDWAIDWTYLRPKAIDEKVAPFVSKKIKEFFGFHDKDVQNFVLDHIRARGKADDLAKEMSKTMDEEANPFVQKIYRMVIFESESMKRGIA